MWYQARKEYSALQSGEQNGGVYRKLGRSERIGCRMERWYSVVHETTVPPQEVILPKLRREVHLETIRCSMSLCSSPRASTSVSFASRLPKICLSVYLSVSVLPLALLPRMFEFSKANTPVGAEWEKGWRDCEHAATGLQHPRSLRGCL